MTIASRLFAFAIVTASFTGSLLSQTTLDLVTSGFGLKFRGDRAWTCSQIDYKGQTISGPAGFHGLVLATGPGMFIGSGHKEGGEEVVESTEITVDGEITEIRAGNIDCQEATVTKRSQIGDWTHVAIVKLTPEKIELDYTIKATKDTYVELMYPFMFCWVPASTEWIAQLKNGSMADGTFRSDNGWQLEKDVEWSAIYFPDIQLAAVLRFAEDLPDGALHKHGFWDREVYHKQYYQSFWKASFTEGQEYRYRVSLQVVPGGTTDWMAEAAGAMKSKNK